MAHLPRAKMDTQSSNQTPEDSGKGRRIGRDNRDTWDRETQTGKPPDAFRFLVAVQGSKRGGNR